MPIYKYTLQKYLKAYSTWIILGISMLLVFVLGGVVPFKFAKIHTATSYAVLSVAIVAAITSFLSVFTSVFAGFKSSTMFKDEVEDGTFLVMLSKPVSRSKIIFFKWIALQTMIVFYTFFVALTFLVAITLFDNGNTMGDELKSLGLKTLRSQIVLISLALWAILYIVALIFSSIALLLSTKLSVGTTIGISIAIGVIIPITSLVGTFTSKPAYKTISNPAAKTFDSLLSSQTSRMKDEFLASSGSADVKSLESALSNLKRTSLVDNPKTLYSLGLATNDSDTFRIGQVFDLNYQVQKLSEFASEQAIPEIARENLDFSHNGQSLKTVTNIALKNNPFSKNAQEQIQLLNQMIVSSWQETQEYRQLASTAWLQLFASSKINGSIVVPSQWVAAKFTTLSNVTEDNKAQFLTELAASNSFTTWINKSLDEQKAFANRNEEIRYSQANVGLNKLMNTINGNNQLLSFTDAQISKYFFLFNEYAKDIFLPLSFWVKSSNVNSFVKEHDVHIDSFIKSEMVIQIQPDEAITDSIGYIKEIMRTDDYTSYNEIVSSITNGFSIAKIKTIEYTNKWTILWIYLAIALALVPAAYFVVRKQDFR